MVKLIIDTGWVNIKGDIVKVRKARAYYVIDPANTYHVFAVAEYRKKAFEELNTEKDGHVVGAIIQVTNFEYLVGKSSIELGERKIKHSEDQLGEAEAVVQQIIKECKLQQAAKRKLSKV